MRSHIRLLLVGALVLPGLTLPAAFAGDVAEAERSPKKQATPAGADETASLYRRALSLETQGLAQDAASAYRQILRIDPDHPAARRALGYEQVKGQWIGRNESLIAKGFVQVAGRWMLREESLTAKAALRGTGSDRTKESAADDLMAARLVRLCLDHEDAGRRKKAAQGLRDLKHASSVQAFGKALSSSREATRIRGAEALGRLGESAAYPLLIKTWEKRSGNFPRSYFSQTKQIAYLQDFDVEVA